MQLNFQPAHKKMKKDVSIHLKDFSFPRAIHKLPPKVSLAKMIDFLPSTSPYLSGSLSKFHKNQHTRRSSIIYKIPHL